MTSETITRATTEAKNFLAAAEALASRIARDRDEILTRVDKSTPDTLREVQESAWRSALHHGCKQTAALRRRSLDLTRALAELRKA